MKTSTDYCDLFPAREPRSEEAQKAFDETLAQLKEMALANPVSVETRLPSTAPSFHADVALCLSRTEFPEEPATVKMKVLKNRGEPTS